MTPWAPDHDAYLKEHYGRVSGRTLVQKLNDKFGTTYSRNALIGRAKRLGLCLDKNDIKKYVIKDVSPAVKKQMRPVKVKPVEIKVVPLGVPFHLLTESQCQWPVGDVFCGLKRDDHRNYCPDHAKANKRRAENQAKELTKGHKAMYGYR